MTLFNGCKDEDESVRKNHPRHIRAKIQRPGGIRIRKKRPRRILQEARNRSAEEFGRRDLCVSLSQRFAPAHSGYPTPGPPLVDSGRWRRQLSISSRKTCDHRSLARHDGSKNPRRYAGDYFEICVERRAGATRQNPLQSTGGRISGHCSVFIAKSFANEVANYGQIEIDELYIGVDGRGAQYVVPVQAKGGNDRLGVIQTIQDTMFCKMEERYRRCIIRPVSAQFMGFIRMDEHPYSSASWSCCHTFLRLTLRGWTRPDKGLKPLATNIL